MRRRARENGAWIRVAFIKKYAGTVLGAALLLALAVFGITYRNEIWAVLTQQDARDAFIAFVHDSGFLGLLALPEPSTLPFWQNTIFCGTRRT